MKTFWSIISCLFLITFACKDDSSTQVQEVEQISTPNTPAGPSTGYINESLSFSCSGAESNLGHDLEYKYYWGDFEYSNWSSSNSASHSWSGTGTMSVKVKARCEEHTDIVSEWSNTKQIIISQASHTVNTPNTPSGPSSGETNQNLTFNTGGSTCNQGHSVEYSFDWDDGTYSNWSSSSTASHSWSNTGTKLIKAQARCASYPNIKSSWSYSKSVNIISDVHEVNFPNQPSGPQNGYVGKTYNFSASGSYCSHGHPVQYRFVWGTSEMSPWSSSNTASHSWDSPGSYYISAQARCAEDTTIVSDWSMSILVITIEDSECQINVTSPSSGEALAVEESHTITWTSVGQCDQHVKIELYKEGSYLCLVNSYTTNNGSYDWTVDDCGGGTNDEYQIKVTSTSTGDYDLSGYFTIVAHECNMDVISPSSGSNWRISETREITWNSSSSGFCGPNLRIELYKISTYMCTITNSTPDEDRSFQWIVDDCGGGTDSGYRIKLISISTGAEEFSNWFTIDANNTIELLPTQDAYVCDGWPNNNYGSNGYLVVGNSYNHYYVFYIQFNLNSIPQNADIESAELILQRDVKWGSFEIIVKCVAELWSENSITFNTTPYQHTFPASFIDPTIGGTNGDLYQITIDVTELVEEWINGSRENYGFSIWTNPQTIPSGNYVHFGSKDNDESIYHPKLKVTYIE